MHEESQVGSTGGVQHMQGLTLEELKIKGYYVLINFEHLQRNRIRLGKKTMISDTSQQIEEKEPQKNEKADDDDAWEDLDDEYALESSNSGDENSCDSNKNENTFPKYRDCKAQQNGSELGKRLRLRQITPEIVDGEVIWQGMRKIELKLQKVDLREALSLEQEVNTQMAAMQRRGTGNCTKKEKEPGGIVTVW